MVPEILPIFKLSLKDHLINYPLNELLQWLRGQAWGRVCLNASQLYHLLGMHIYNI